MIPKVFAYGRFNFSVMNITTGKTVTKPVLSINFFVVTIKSKLVSSYPRCKGEELWRSLFQLLSTMGRGVITERGD